MGTLIKDAATIVLIRDPGDDPKVLMGKRASRAAFMPDKFVFPGGAVEVDDTMVNLTKSVSEPCATRLEGGSAAPSSGAIVSAAIRELWEETGLIYGKSGHWNGPLPQNWRGFCETGFLPTAAGMHYIFRAITPPGRARRFDARFLLADAAGIAGRLDDFSGASGELSNLRWIPVNRTYKLDLAFITQVVLRSILEMLPDIGAPETLPFFSGIDEQEHLDALGQRYRSGEQ